MRSKRRDSELKTMGAAAKRGRQLPLSNELSRVVNGGVKQVVLGFVAPKQQICLHNRMSSQSITRFTCKTCPSSSHCGKIFERCQLESSRLPKSSACSRQLHFECPTQARLLPRRDKNTTTIPSSFPTGSLHALPFGAEAWKRLASQPWCSSSRHSRPVQRYDVG